MIGLDVPGYADATRCVTKTRTEYSPTFRAYALERLRDAENRQRREQGRTELAAGARFDPPYDLVREVARELHVTPHALHNWIRWHNRACGTSRAPRELTARDRAAMRAWELAHAPDKAMRQFAAVVAEMPEPSRSAIEQAYAKLSPAEQERARPALDAYLMAADLADEVRRLVGVATAAIREAVAAVRVIPVAYP